MSATDIAAWIGATTGTLTLLWDIFKWSKTGPRISVSAAPNMVAFGVEALAVGEAPCVVVEASNVGDGKTTITHVIALYYDSWLQRLFRRRPTQTWVVPDPRPGKLPHVLDKGERWVGMMEQNEDLIRMSQNGYLFCGVWHSTANKPVLARLVIHDAPQA